MRVEVHVHADIPILEGVSKKQIEQALAPWLEYLDAEGLGDVKSLEPDEPGLKFDEKDLMLYLCWTGEIGRSTATRRSRSTSRCTRRTATRKGACCSSARPRRRSTKRNAAA